jgi:peptide deformylase
VEQGFDHPFGCAVKQPEGLRAPPILDAPPGLCHHPPMSMNLRLWPEPVLLRAAPPVTAFDAELGERIAEMFTVMYEEKGVGLAAPQVGWDARVLVLNPEGSRKDESGALAVINPRILKRWGRAKAEEGCLSFPDIFVEVDRPAGIRLAWQDEKGAAHEQDWNDFPARILQHEMDHLDGVTLWHRMSPVDRIRWRTELDELRAMAADAARS